MSLTCLSGGLGGVRLTVTVAVAATVTVAATVAATVTVL